MRCVKNLWVHGGRVGRTAARVLAGGSWARLCADKVNGRDIRNCASDVTMRLRGQEEREQSEGDGVSEERESLWQSVEFGWVATGVGSGSTIVVQAESGGAGAGAVLVRYVLGVRLSHYFDGAARGWIGASRDAGQIASERGFYIKNGCISRVICHSSTEAPSPFLLAL